MFPEHAARPSPPRPAHPGAVTFVAADGSERAEPADQLPDWLKFAPGADGTPVPVVRVVRTAAGLRSYGPGGLLLSVTLPAVAPAVPSVPAGLAARRPAREPVAATGWF